MDSEISWAKTSHAHWGSETAPIDEFGRGPHRRPGPGGQVQLVHVCQDAVAIISSINIQAAISDKGERLRPWMRPLGHSIDGLVIVAVDQLPMIGLQVEPVHVIVILIRPTYAKGEQMRKQPRLFVKSLISSF